MYEHKNKFLAALFLLLVIIDQFSKYLIRLYGGFFACNENIAFGINLPSWFFFILWSGIVIFLGRLFFSPDVKKNLFLQGALVFIFAGAIGNMSDRILSGCVYDFIVVGFWPAFNLADCFITLGAFSYLAKKLKM